MFTIYNATLVAVMQVGVIVAGVLASGFWHKFYLDSDIEMPFPTGLLYHYGLFGLAIPFVWLVTALALHWTPAVSAGVETLAFWLGVLVLITLAAFVIYANISPLFHGTWSLSGGNDT